MCSNFFLNNDIQKKHNIEVVFSLPFYEYDEKYKMKNKPTLDYSIFDNLDILVIEINSLTNNASSCKIINYCKIKNIQIIRTL